MKRRFFALLFALSMLFLCVSCAPAKQPADDELSQIPVPVPSQKEPHMDDETSEPDPEPEPEPAPEPTSARTSFFAVGDNIIHTGIWRQANRNTGGSGNDCQMQSAYDFAPFYESIRPYVQEADIAFLNQETLVAADESKAPSNYPAFNTPRACGDAMLALGFDVVSIANNHMLDMGSSGLANSIAYWNEKENVTLLGAYQDKEDYDTVRVLEKNGIRIAFLAYAEDPNNSGLGTKVDISNYNPYSSRGIYVAALNEAVVREQVQRARSLADFVLVSVHWGTENTGILSPVQTYYASLLASLGTDVILGTHPHVIQRMEWMEGNTSSGKTLAVYSLGNLISLMESMGSNMLGGALSLDFVKEGEKTSLENVVFIPLVTHCSSNYRDIRVCLLENYTEQDYANHCIHRYCTTSYSEFGKIVAEQIDSQFWGTKSYGG